jgi:hypothetical protein
MDTSVKVAVRIRPLIGEEVLDDNNQSSICINVVPGNPQVNIIYIIYINYILLNLIFLKIF